jgi:hypothetical protein
MGKNGVSHLPTAQTKVSGYGVSSLDPHQLVFFQFAVSDAQNNE